MSTFNCTIDNLPTSITSKFTALDFRVCRYMNKIFNKRKEVIALDKSTICPALETISRAVEAGIWSVSRSLSKLCTLGVIFITHTRKRDGTYFLNKYSLGNVVRDIFKAFQYMKKFNKSLHLRKNATVVKKELEEDNCIQYIGHILDYMEGKKSEAETLAVVDRL